MITNNLTMKDSNFFYRSVATLFLLMSVLFKTFGVPVRQEYFEVRIYSISQKSQEERIDAYLKDAYLPALHRAGISKAGVFKPIESDTAFGKLVYVFIPFKTIDQFMQLPELLEKDMVYVDAGKSFTDAPYNDPPFKRYESILLKAFRNMPQFAAPEYSNPASERIYELRSYESSTDAKAAKKIQMFNDGGEITLFEKIGANAVFYGQVLLGSLKPRLMYMTTYSDMKSHDDHWKAFRESAEWKKLSGMEEYKNTVSKANPYLLHPTSYSDF
jgi:hypothetical protein